MCVISMVSRLLSAQVSYSMHSQARVTFETAMLIIKKLTDANTPVNLAGLYSAISGLRYLECNYNEV